VTDPLYAYQLSKRGNSLRVMAEAVRWGKRGARVNTIIPCIIFTPLAKDELTGPRGEGYRQRIELSAVGRGDTADEVGSVGALLMGPDGAFITGERLPHGWRSHGCLLVRRTRSEVIEWLALLAKAGRQ
jgi:NAD(P)-dependent dehydrogenase (short-subunit alcohol dehydrogenase family)